MALALAALHLPPFAPLSPSLPLTFFSLLRRKWVTSHSPRFHLLRTQSSRKSKCGLKDEALRLSPVLAELPSRASEPAASTAASSVVTGGALVQPEPMMDGPPHGDLAHLSRSHSGLCNPGGGGLCRMDGP